MNYGIGHCEICNKAFTRYRPFHKFCSDRCREIAYEKKYRYKKKEETTKKCKLCGKTFTTNDGKRHYCSKECYSLYQEKVYKKKDPEKRTCMICGAEFMSTHHAKHYCSKTCYNEAKRLREVKSAVSEVKE